MSGGWRSWAAGTALVAMGTLSGWLLCFGVEMALFRKDPRLELPPCFEIGEPFHHRFRPGCAGVLYTPRGEVSFSVNEDMLRELPRREILDWPRRFLVVGDSFVEGWWAAREETISAALTAANPGTYFINAGLRSTGSLMHARRLKSLLEIYRPAGIVWILNDTDGLDDRLSCSVAREPGVSAERLEFEAPEFQLTGWRGRLARLLGDSLPGKLFRRQIYQRRWLELTRSERAGRCSACRGVEEFSRIAREAGVSILPIYLAGGFPDPTGHYSAGRPPRSELLGCLAHAGLEVFLAGERGLDPAAREQLFWEDDFHLNPEGVQYLAENIAPALEAYLKGGKPNARSRKR